MPIRRARADPAARSGDRPTTAGRAVAPDRPPTAGTCATAASACPWPSSSTRPCPGSASPGGGRSPTLSARAWRSTFRFSFWSDQPAVPAAWAQTIASGSVVRIGLVHLGRDEAVRDRTDRRAFRAPSGRRANRRHRSSARP